MKSTRTRVLEKPDYAGELALNRLRAIHEDLAREAEPVAREVEHPRGRGLRDPQPLDHADGVRLHAHDVAERLQVGHTVLRNHPPLWPKFGQQWSNSHSAKSGRKRPQTSSNSPNSMAKLADIRQIWWWNLGPNGAFGLTLGWNR